MTKPGTPSKEELAQSAARRKAFSAPQLAYRPQELTGDLPGIGVIGCGAITVEHLAAYRSAGYNVRALCDIRGSRAEARREEYFPQADVYTDADELLARDDIAVADITTHPPERVELIEKAIAAGKHVLSQKPFVENLDVGERLCDLADRRGVLLAVNQNGRWAPHFSYLLRAVEAGLLGSVSAAHAAVHWDHGWTKGTPFEEIHHLVLYDFAIHWFDLITCVMQGALPETVFATCRRSATQEVKPPLLCQASLTYADAQASLVFDADTRFGSWDTTYVTGSAGTLLSQGPDIKQQSVELHNASGVARPELEGVWFPDGFHGTMAELLAATVEDRTPSHNARGNLASLAVCFAAVASAERGEPVTPGTVRSLTVE